MRILLLNDRIPPENRGGAGEVVWRLAVALCDNGHDVHVAAATPNQSFNEVRDGIPTYHLHVRYPERWRAWLSLYNPQTVKPLRELYQQIQPDIINAHNIHADLTYHSLTLAQQMGIPAVFSSHDVMPFAYQKLSHFIDPNNHDPNPPVDYRLPPLFNLKQMRLRYNPFRNVTIRRILTQSAQVRTAPSQALCDAHAANGLPPFTCVHNGIDADWFRASATTIDNLRARLGLVGRKVILFAGRLTGAKGTQQLLQALQKVVVAVPETTLLVLSSVPIAEQVNQPQYAELREKHIISGGWLAGEALAAAFHLASVVTVPSIIFDSFPTINLEAMAAQKPVLATCFGGSREAVVDGLTGFIINPFATDDFAEKLIWLLSDDTLRLQMGTAASKRVTTEFTMDRQVVEMLRVYQQAIDLL
jgi:glycosyltransferase involved in cell wall biosynthesis